MTPSALGAGAARCLLLGLGLGGRFLRGSLGLGLGLWLLGFFLLRLGIAAGFAAGVEPAPIFHRKALFLFAH